MPDFGKLSSISKRWNEAIDRLVAQKPRYWYGGEDPLLGLDCSGLVAYVLGRAGWPGQARLTASAYMTSVFGLRTRPSGLGEYANVFCAYGLKEENGSFSHICLPYAGSLMVESVTAPRDRVFPGVVLALEEPYYDWVGTRSNRPLGEDVDQRFWDLAELVASVYINRSVIGGIASHPDFTGNFTGVAGGAALPRTQAMITQIHAWTFDIDALVEILALLFGRDRRILYEEAVTAAADADNSAVRLLVGRTGSAERTLRMMVGISKSLNTAFRFADLWTQIRDDLSRPDMVNPLASGVRVRDRDSYTVGTLAGSYTIGYLSEAQLASFLESEAYEVTPPSILADKLQRVPVRGQ